MHDTTLALRLFSKSSDRSVVSFVLHSENQSFWFPKTATLAFSFLLPKGYATNFFVFGCRREEICR